VVSSISKRDSRSLVDLADELPLKNERGRFGTSYFHREGEYDGPENQADNQADKTRDRSSIDNQPRLCLGHYQKLLLFRTQSRPYQKRRR